jgi:hypothetical protein
MELDDDIKHIVKIVAIVILLSIASWFVSQL